MIYQRRKSTKKIKAPFPHKLILNQWILWLFNVKTFDEFTSSFRKNEKDGLDKNNVHHFHKHIVETFTDLQRINSTQLLHYDQNIVQHTKHINEARLNRGEPPIVWKYFQYLTLLFCEIYLDRYFQNPASLLSDLNVQIDNFNLDKRKHDRIKRFSLTDEAWSQLNKVSLWMATGSGKTLLMHINLLQYLNALSKYGRERELNHILLLTPNEGLSHQHLREFDASNINARLFDKRGTPLYNNQTVEIIEITKLRDRMGDKTVDVDAFEGANLVLVDEGHRGASSGRAGQWMAYRNALCQEGFSFEYSATFGQAIKGNPELTQLYAKNILCDYSYRYFYADGYGKDYQILNLDQNTQQDYLDLYLVACLLSFFQQLQLYQEHKDLFRPFNIENPLWIFVGGRVTATLAKRDASDIVQILKFLDRYVSHRSESIQCIDRVLRQGLITATGKNLFSDHFSYLNTLGLSHSIIYEETLSTIFNAPNGGQLYIEDIKGASGEIALRLGNENDPFGVINVGDDAKLIKICKEKGLNTGDLLFSKSLFHELNQPESNIHLLIGSKKFTEGWNSWRVSTMGLMNVGRGEGAQIIQLFGRGIRLKGHKMSLLRSTSLPKSMDRPKHIDLLETLGIFGIHADYMAQFRDFLDEEGLPPNEERIEFILPVIKNLGTSKLRTIQIKKKIHGVATEEGKAFRALGPVPTIAPPDPENDPDTQYLLKHPVRLNWYPKIHAMRSQASIGEEVDAVPHQTHLRDEHLAFFDYDALYFELERFRVERGWYNLNLSPSAIKDLLHDPQWYWLTIPPEEMIPDSYEKVHLWQDIALSLLKQYIQRYYTFRRNQWELPHMEYDTLTDDDPNLLGASDSSDNQGYYRILIDRSKDDIVSKLEELKGMIEEDNEREWEFRGIKAHWYKNHLFKPLLSMESNLVEITPAPLNTSEQTFIEDLKHFHVRFPEFFKTRDLYLLRNLTRGRGVGFFEASNFYPDFILWLLSGGKQHVLFVDPKGIRYLLPQDPKIQFFQTIKEIEERLGDPNITLHSFIISNTPSSDLAPLWKMERDEMEKLNVLFQDEDHYYYIRKMLFSVSNYSE